ncbi:MAG: flavin reductase family protein [Candidatus Hodarchaeaceae archaeon]|nr:flavin reductase family protein [Candidatus Hodarchaeaceae archaeon]
MVAPRPIVLVTTVDKNGRINAAPMSFVMPVEMDPPILAFSTSYESDTYRNISETGEFVANLVTAEVKKQMYICGRSFPRGVNELEKAGLHWEPSKKVKPPGVVECPANLECKLEWTHEGPEYIVVAGRVVAMNVRKGTLRAGKLNVEQVKPLLHLSGKSFIIGDHTTEL